MLKNIRFQVQIALCLFVRYTEINQLQAPDLYYFKMDFLVYTLSSYRCPVASSNTPTPMQPLEFFDAVLLLIWTQLKASRLMYSQNVFTIYFKWFHCNTATQVFSGIETELIRIHIWYTMFYIFHMSTKIRLIWLQVYNKL